MPKNTPDEYGRLRVRDKDTGHERTIPAEKLHLGDYVVLSGPASDLSGDPLPETRATPKTPVEPTTTGQSADLKENSDD